MAPAVARSTSASNKAVAAECQVVRRRSRTPPARQSRLKLRTCMVAGIDRLADPAGASLFIASISCGALPRALMADGPSWTYYWPGRRRAQLRWAICSSG